MSDVRPWVVTVTTIAVLAFTTLVIDTPQNWASVMVLVVAPAAIGIGAYWPNLLPGRVRLTAVVIVFALFVIGIGSLTLASSGLRSGEVIDEFPDRGLGMVGPEWHPGSPGYAIATSTQSEVGDATLWQAEFAPGVSLSTFTGLRLEGWRVTDDGIRLDPASPEPFASATVARDGRTLSALIDTTNEPGVVHWSLILTGVGADGVRYVIDASTGGASTFTGSVWDWVVAVIDD